MSEMHGKHKTEVHTWPIPFADARSLSGWNTRHVVVAFCKLRDTREFCHINMHMKSRWPAHTKNNCQSCTYRKRKASVPERSTEGGDKWSKKDTPPPQHFSPSSEPAAATLSWWRMSNNPLYGPWLQRPWQVCQGRQKHICHSPLHSQSMQSGPDPK